MRKPRRHWSTNTVYNGEIFWLAELFSLFTKSSKASQHVKHSDKSRRKKRVVLQADSSLDVSGLDFKESTTAPLPNFLLPSDILQTAIVEENEDSTEPAEEPVPFRSRLPTNGMGKRRRFSSTAEQINQVINPPRKSKRHQRVIELLDTERNYINIMSKMLEIIREIPTEVNSPYNTLLHPDALAEINTTFSQLPQLLEVHQRIVKDLEKAVENWTEDVCIGTIFTKYGPYLEAYVPFVNAFEKIKAFLQEWEEKCTLFQSYLKVCRMQPGCGRQHLNDLLIRPIQRVPSVVTLLKDIKSRTDVNNPDCEELGKAITEVERVLEFINDQKKEAEVSQLLLNIENEHRPGSHCVSSSSYVSHIECYELEDDQFSAKGDTLMIIIFETVLQVCGKVLVRAHRKSSVLAQKKQWEHIDYIPLQEIREIIDVPDDRNCIHAFALVLKTIDNEECHFKFATTDRFAMKKSLFLRQIFTQVPRSNLDRPVLRRMDCREVRIRTTSVLACQQPGLRRSVSLLAKKLQQMLSFPHSGLRRAARDRLFSDGALLPALRGTVSIPGKLSQLSPLPEDSRCFWQIETRFIR